MWSSRVVPKANRTLNRIHRYWSAQLLAGGVVSLALVGGGVMGCDSSKQKSADNAEKASSESPQKEKSQGSAKKEKQPEAAQDDDGERAKKGDDVPIPGGTEPRTFEFTYEATVKPGESDGDGEVDIFLPVATDGSHQKILDKSIDSPFDGEIKEESTYGNSYWHASLDELPDEPKTITMTYEVRREVFRRDSLAEEVDTQFEKDERKEFELFLQANERVPTSGDLIEDVAEDIGFDQYDSPAREARAIYDYVVDTMEYKKVGDGWGNGDTYWACTEKYGNCTDFHALFTSLARYREIPARFEIGFPVPTDRDSGKIGGYHCWLDFYLPGVGWTPIDASEASKKPKYKDMFFGTHPADRIQFSTGRDLQLGDAHDSEPLNYFIYPMVEVGEKRYDEVDTAFSYEATNT